MEIAFGNFKTTVDTFMLELGDVDMILGVSWLQKQGKVTSDWKEKVISFHWGGEMIMLKGEQIGESEKQWGGGMMSAASLQSVLLTGENREGSMGMQTLNKQQQMKYADRRRKEKEFKVGEWVFLKLRPHRQQTVARRINQKLAPRYYGPFPIVSRVGRVSYNLKFPASTKVHQVFHISQLKRAVGDYQVAATLPDGLEVEEDTIEEPGEVLATCDIWQQVRQHLVKWKGKDKDDVTWIDDVMLQSQFPDFSLEDKAAVKEVGNVGNSGVEAQKPICLKWDRSP